jgi:hypothetical protein
VIGQTISHYRVIENGNLLRSQTQIVNYADA